MDANVALGEPDHLMREAIMDEGGNHGCECSTRRAGSPDEGGNQHAISLSRVDPRAEEDHLMREAIRGHQLGPSDAIKTQSRSFGGT